MYLGDRIAFSAAAAILSVYNIVPVEGEGIPKSFVYQDAITRCDLKGVHLQDLTIFRRPEDLKCMFTPREGALNRLQTDY